VKNLHDTGECKIEGAEPQNRKYVGGVNDERIATDGQNRWDGIQSEEQVCGFHHKQDDKQRSSHEDAVPFHKEFVALVFFGHLDESLCQFDNRVST
jgi:hypothetical protein